MKQIPLSHPGYENRHWLVMKYQQAYLKACAKLAAPQTPPIFSNEIVLDFGCNKRPLKKLLPGSMNYVGYDIDSKYTEIENYKTINPDIVIASHVLEHMSDEEIYMLCRWIKSTNCKKFIVALPLEHLPASLAQYIFGSYFKIKTIHINNWVNIFRILNQYFTNTKLETVWHMTVVSEWVRGD